MARFSAIIALLAASLICGNTMAIAPFSIGQSIDEDAIKEVMAKHVEAWNAHDVDAWAEYFAPDADFMGWSGAAAHGRDSIKEFHAPLFKGMFKHSELRILDLKVRFYAKDVATADGDEVLGGVLGPDGEALQQQGLSFLCVLKKEHGKWLMGAMHYVRQIPLEDARKLQ